MSRRFLKALFERELFGHARGAFTGAVRASPGLVEDAEGGTLLLDEISEVPLTCQAKLLELAETRRYRPVGDVRERLADVRLLAASNRELALEVEAGRFRRDLYFRLNVLPIVIPPLRERKEDLRSLVHRPGSSWNNMLSSNHGKGSSSASCGSHGRGAT